MLQWMGGSRQKIKASRRSTEKRQRQYFEQRKRQQQVHHNTSSEVNVDGFHKSNQQPKEKRSLDILSLQNMPAVSEGCITSPYEVIFPSEGPTSTVTIDPATNSVINTGAVPARAVLSQLVKTMSPKRVQMDKSDLQDITSLENHDKLEQSKYASSNKFQELCVLGLCGDEANDHPKELTKHEPHVAFSMEGLGNMRTETPVHSPSPPSRKLSDSRSLFSKAKAHQHKSKTAINLLDVHEVDMEYLVLDHDLQFRSKYLDLDYQSAGRFKSSVDQKDDFLYAQSGTRPGSKGYQMNLSGEANNLVDVHGVDNGFWDDGECFDPQIETEFNTRRSSGLYCSGKCSSKDYHLGGDPFSLNRSWRRSCGTFCNLDDPSPYTQLQQAAGDYSFLTPYESKISSHEDNLPPLSYLLMDIGNRMSRASSSSSSVSGYGSSDASFARMNVHRRYDDKVFSGHSKNLDATGHGNDWHHLVEDDGFPEESWDISSPLHWGFGSEKIQHQLHRSRSCSPLGQDRFAVADFHLDCPVGFRKSKDDTFLESSPPAATSMDFHINCRSPPRPFVSAASFASFSPRPSCFCEGRLGLYDSCLEPDKNVQSGSSKISGKEFLDQEELSTLSKMGSLCKPEKSDERNVTKPEKDMYVGARISDVNSENGRVADAAKEVNIPEGISTEEDVDESPTSIISVSVNIADDFLSSAKEEVCYNDTSPLSHRKRKGVTSEGENSSSSTSTKPSCQLMMLESYVLQLLCVPSNEKDKAVM